MGGVGQPGLQSPVRHSMWGGKSLKKYFMPNVLFGQLVLESSIYQSSKKPRWATMALSTVQVHALSGGRFTLPETQFVNPASSRARKTVPSLCFLIQHASSTTRKTTRIVFDLGVRRDTSRYSEPIRRHITTRQPLKTDPDVVKSLSLGGLTPEDIDYVIYSHVTTP